MRLPLLIASLAVLASPAPAQNAPAPVTRDQAIALPPDQLAEIVLRQLGARVTSVTRPNFGPDTDTQMTGALQHLAFATASHATDVVGLCAANLIEVDFEPPPARPAADTNGAGTPVRVQSVRAMEVYKVIGELEPYAEVSEDRAAEEDRRCAGAGPVIPADNNDQIRATFFPYRGSIGRVTALLVLQHAITEAREGRYRNVGCDAPADACRNPPALLGSIDLANLTALDAAPVIIAWSLDHYRVAASFLIPVGTREREYWTIAIETDLSGTDGLVDLIRNLGRTHMARAVTSGN